jgi:hypothetical protein
MKDPNRYPPGLDAQRVRDIIEHYENQSDAEAAAEDEEAWADPGAQAVLVPSELVPAVQALIDHYRTLHEELEEQPSLVEVV